MKFPVPGMGYIYLNCSSKKSYGNPPNNPGFDKTTGCPPQTDDKVLLLKRILHNSRNMEKWSWCLLSAFTLLTSVTGTGRSSALYQRRTVSITLATNYLSYNTDQHERCASVALSCGTKQSISSYSKTRHKRSYQGCIKQSSSRKRVPRRRK